MSCLVYLETNWIIGAVMGQDLRADDLLASKSDIRLVMPGVCIMEAISAFDWKRIERNRLKDELAKQLKQLNRSTNISTAQHLAGELTQADLTNASLLSELFQRLDRYLTRIAGRVDLIPISPDDIYHQLQLVEDTGLDRDDALILASILSHAQTYPTIKKSLLTRNVNDFQRQPVKDLLNVAGLRLFSSTQNVIGWAFSDSG